VIVDGANGRQLVASVAERLRSEAEARWIVGQAVGLSPTTFFGVIDQPVSRSVVDVVREMTERRAGGEPLQYVLGEWSFRRLEVRVDCRALVPRPETEVVVEVALGELRRMARAAEGPATGRATSRVTSRATETAPTLVAVDLGTGSGVIALSLAVEGPDGLEVWATDVSGETLELARSNVSAAGLAQPGSAVVHVAEGSWFDALPEALVGGLQLVVSNPPYISEAEWAELDPVVRDHEPRLALVPGASGAEALETLIDDARRWLAPGGSLVLELAPHQAPVMAARAEGAGYTGVGVQTDLTGRDRILVARRPR